MIELEEELEEFGVAVLRILRVLQRIHNVACHFSNGLILLSCLLSFCLRLGGLLLILDVLSLLKQLRRWLIKGTLAHH